MEGWLVRCSTSADGTAWPRPIACASASTRWSASSNAAGALGGERGSASVRPSLLDRHQSARCSLNGSVAQWLMDRAQRIGSACVCPRATVRPARNGARGITITRRTARQPAAARAAACRAAVGSSIRWARTSRKVVRVGQQVRQERIRGDRLREGAARSAHDLHRTACVCDANHGSRAAHHVRHARALARRRRRRVLPRPLELLRSGGGATEGGHTQPPAVPQQWRAAGRKWCGTTSRADSMVASASRCSCRRKRRSPPTRSRTSVAGDSVHRPHAWMPRCGIPWRVR